MRTYESTINPKSKQQLQPIYIPSKIKSPVEESKINQGSIPLINNKLLLAKWQSVFCIDLDGERRERKVTIKVLGE